MARIETDPNYSGPTFSRATAATDLFKKEDVQGLAAAMSAHTHGAGAGLAVTRIGVLTQDITFGFTPPTIIADGLQFQTSVANSATILNVLANGTGTASAIYMYPSSTTVNATRAEIYCSTGGAVFVSGRSGSGSYMPMSFSTSGVARMTIAVDGAISMTGILTAAGLITSGAGTISSGGNVQSKSGGYYAGASDQSFLQMWNPGEFRISSTPGNLYALGGITAEGAPVTGKGAYVNSASSASVKSNIAELDPAACLSQVLDPRMRPVSFEYTEPQPQATVPRTTLEHPSQLVDWTPERLGFIAEEVAEVVPQAAGIIEGTNVAHGLTIEALTPVLWGAVRALTTRVEALEGSA